MTGGRGPGRLHRRRRPGGARHDARRLRTTGSRPALYLATDRPHALRQAIHACRKGGTVSIPGVYGGFLDKFPIGAAFAKGLTLKMGQTHVQRYLRPLLERIERGEIDPSFVITHRRQPRRRARDVPDVPRQAGRLHQGRDEAALMAPAVTRRPRAAGVRSHARRWARRDARTRAAIRWKEGQS